ncbi:MAG TPA: hypothetical protein PKG48_03960 [Bacteroidales bacterium]|nr:hypothetical protein [Bacteroidales bacterium]HPS62312.1 hypothetical protein [Bacteroidales bacterium]
MEQRKNDHIALAFTSQSGSFPADDRFLYEPALGPFPGSDFTPFTFLGKTLRVPLWVSSMTGGSREAGTINRNLARACAEFGMGMGLGSCRILLERKEVLPDFDLRSLLGHDLPLYANIGIAQAEKMAGEKNLEKLNELVALLKADGLIVHLNPVQEWLQVEGDPIRRPAVETLEEVIARTGLRIIVKEVGQGMGPGSIAALMALPIEAFEFGAYGGTNFARVELARRETPSREWFEPLATVGHTAEEMLEIINRLAASPQPPACRQLIISGGIQSFLDGHYFLAKSLLPAVYGQASGFLRHARGGYDELHNFIAGQLEGLKFARSYLKIRTQ